MEMAFEELYETKFINIVVLPTKFYLCEKDRHRFYLGEFVE